MGYGILLKTRQPCSKCGSSDACHLYRNPDTGSVYAKCYACTATYKPDSKETKMTTSANIRIPFQPVEGKPFTKPWRGIFPETLEAYGVSYLAEQVERQGARPLPKNSVVFGFYNSTGVLVAQKIKFPVTDGKTKAFEWIGYHGQALFFGANRFQSGKFLTVTEGEIDAMSAFQMSGSKFPFVSVKDGAQSKLSKEEIAYSKSFAEVRINFDADEPGLLGARKLAKTLGSKCSIVELNVGTGKDANDYLQAACDNDYLDCWWAAKPYRPDSILFSSETKSFLSEKAAETIAEYPWNGLNGVLHKIRPAELIVITAGSGVGKSAILKSIAYHVKTNFDLKQGMMFLEETPKITVTDMVGIDLGKFLRIPAIAETVSLEEKTQSWERLFGSDDFVFWNHFGSKDLDSLEEQLRFMSETAGCKIIYLDHISILVSSQEGGDERKNLDAIMTRLATLTNELGITIIAVSHLKRSDSTPHEEGGVTSLAQLRGSAGIGQLAWIVLGLERNGQSEDPFERNLTTVRVLKNRITGETGPAAHLYWERDTGRFVEIERSELEEQRSEIAKAKRRESVENKEAPKD